MSIHINTSIKEIRKEVRHLVEIHSLNLGQALYSLSQFFSAAEWVLVECEIETKGYSLMTNSVADFLGD